MFIISKKFYRPKDFKIKYYFVASCDTITILVKIFFLSIGKLIKLI